MQMQEKYAYIEAKVNFTITLDKVCTIVMQENTKHDNIPYTCRVFINDEPIHSMLDISHRNKFIHTCVINTENELYGYIDMILCSKEVKEYKQVELCLVVDSKNMLKFMFYNTSNMPTIDFELLVPDLESHVYEMQQRITKTENVCIYEEFKHFNEKCINDLKEYIKNTIYTSDCDKFIIYMHANHDHRWENQRKIQLNAMCNALEKNQPLKFDAKNNYWANNVIYGVNCRSPSHVNFLKEINPTRINNFMKTIVHNNEEELLEYTCKQIIIMFYWSLFHKQDEHYHYIEIVKLGSSHFVYVIAFNGDKYKDKEMIDNLNIRLDKLEKKNAKLEKKNAKLKKENAELKQQVAEANVRIDRLEKENAELRQELTEMKEMFMNFINSQKKQ